MWKRAGGSLVEASSKEWDYMALDLMLVCLERYCICHLEVEGPSRFHHVQAGMPCVHVWSVL